VTLLTKLRRRGIEIHRVGDQLEAIASEGTFTSAALTFLRQHWHELLAETAAPSYEGKSVGELVETRAAVLRGCGLTPVEAERQAAEEILPLDGAPAHESARCDLHGCAERQLPGSILYRCPACLPERFARRRPG
jgi:hypothetical protein